MLPGVGVLVGFGWDLDFPFAVHIIRFRGHDIACHVHPIAECCCPLRRGGGSAKRPLSSRVQLRGRPHSSPHLGCVSSLFIARRSAIQMLPSPTAGCCLAAVTLAVYAIGACPNCIRSWDIYTSQYVVLGAINTKGFQPVLRTTKFGGTLLATAVVVAGALCTDVLVQYVYEYGIEHSMSTPALDSSARSTTNARVDLALSALRSPSQAQASCSLSSLTSSASVSGGFSLVSQSLPAPGPPNSSGLCSFAVSCPSVTVSVSPYAVYASQPTPGAVTVGLGPYLQLSSWSLTIGAAKPGAYTVGQPKSRCVRGGELARTLTGSPSRGA